MIEDVTYYDEGTMFKVRAALHEALDAEGVAWDYLLDACVTEMQNAGILFRERREESKPVPYCPACDLGEGHTGPHVKLPPHEPDQLPARGEGDRG